MFCALYKFLVEGNIEGYFDAPTGFGKTVLMTQIIRALRNVNEKIFIIVPRTHLLTQTKDELALYCEEMDSGLMYSLKKEFEKKIIIFTYDTFQRMISSKKLDPLTIKYLFLDEPHMALSEKRSEVVKECKNALKLGFTATDFYSEEKQVSKILEKKIFKVTIKQGVEEGFLAPFRVIIAETNVDLSNVKITGKDYNPKLLAKAVILQSRNLSAVLLHKETSEFKNESTLINCVNISHAKDVAKLFRKHGYKAKAVHSKLTTTDVEVILADFKKGKLQILCNVNIVGVGFNAPIASICFNLKPTCSIVVATQRVRNIRINPNNPQKFAYIVDFIDQDKRGNRALSYADITEETYIIPKKSCASDSKGKYTVGNIPTIEGLKVHVNSQKIYEILNSDSIEKKLSYEKWIIEITNACIKGWEDYRAIVSEHPMWPKNPYKHYPNFKGFTFITGKRFTLLSFEDFSQKLAGLEIFTNRDYADFYKKNKEIGLPLNPELTYGVKLFLDPDEDFNTNLIKKTYLLEELCRLNADDKLFFYKEHYDIEFSAISDMVRKEKKDIIWDKLIKIG
jgi:superfamily II DNA or RNA helicase